MDEWFIHPLTHPDPSTHPPIPHQRTSPSFPSMYRSLQNLPEIHTSHTKRRRRKTSCNGARARDTAHHRYQEMS